MTRSTIPWGCLTAEVTPFNQDESIDWKGLERNNEFQIAEGVKGVVPVGTTGESPTLSSEEHILVVGRTAQVVRKRIFVLAGCGSNSTLEALHYTKVASIFGCDGALLVDCYYNGPSSLELREEYYSTIAGMFSDLAIVPYIIPGRTGCAFSPEDLAILANRCPNVEAVKEATGDLERMRRTRKLTPGWFQIFSGDDDRTFPMMTDPEIQAKGVISVISNIAPGAVQAMCEKVLAGDIEGAQKVRESLDPLFRVVTVNQERKEILRSPGGELMEVVAKDRFRNPLPIKTMMQGLGMPAGPCRSPLGKMTPQGVEEIRNALRTVWEKNPEIFKPIEEFYSVDISARLADDTIWAGLSFKGD